MTDLKDMTVDEALAHFGKKGMKWGVRKDGGSSGSKPTSADIQSARQRHNARINRANQVIDSTSPIASNKVKQHAVNELHRIANEAKKNPQDIDLAFKSTRGEKVASVLMAGPFGPTLLKKTLKNQREVADAVLGLYKDAKIKDLD